MKFSFWILLSGTLLACDTTDQDRQVSNLVKDKDGTIIEGTAKSYYKSKQLKAEVEFKNKVRNGLSKIYYESGGVKSETTYVNGQKEGKARRYYKNGQLNLDYNYLNNNLHGIQKKYRENGLLKSEAIYKNGNPGMGLKEYLLNGDPKKKYPKIIIEESNQTAINGSFTLTVRLSDNSKRVEYFLGQLDEGKFISSNIHRISNTDGKFRLTYYVPPGGFLVKELNIIAKVKTRLLNYYIITKHYNLAVENRM
jgi:antitoxin component YwqK of YwqJK toxin-antitoxin module